MNYPKGNCIYIISCPNFNGLYKIGKTKNLKQMMKSQTGIPHKLNLFYYHFTEDMDIARTIIHYNLRKFRVDKKKIWFKIDNPQILVDEISNVIEYLRWRKGFYEHLPGVSDEERKYDIVIEDAIMIDVNLID